MWFMSVDLPTFGIPTMEMKPARCDEEAEVEAEAEAGCASIASVGGA